MHVVVALMAIIRLVRAVTSTTLVLEESSGPTDNVHQRITVVLTDGLYGFKLLRLRDAVTIQVPPVMGKDVR